MHAKATILLVDDSPGECELFRTALQQSGYLGALETTHSRAEAWDYLQSVSDAAPSAGTSYAEPPALPALIVLDLKLRGELGLDLLRQLRDEPRYTHIPVVILTTSDDLSDVRACYQAGANSYIVKPERFDHLLTVAQTLWKYWVECNCSAQARLAC